MKTISKLNKSGTYTMQNKSVDGMTVTVMVQALPAQVIPFAIGDMLDLDAMQLRCILKRGGNETEIFNHTLRQLIILSYLTQSTYQWISNMGINWISYTASTGMVPLRFDFGGPITLTGDDTLTITYMLNDSFWLGYSGANAGHLDSGSCYIEIDECETSDVEFYIPITKSWAIETNQNVVTLPLGSNIMTLVYANYDNTFIDPAHAIINSVSLKTNTISKEETFNELSNKQQSYYDDPWKAFMRFQNWVFYDGSDEIDNVTLTLNLNSSRVLASKNWILARAFYSDNATITRGETLQAAKTAAADLKGVYDHSLTHKRRN